MACLRSILPKAEIWSPVPPSNDIPYQRTCFVSHSKAGTAQFVDGRGCRDFSHSQVFLPILTDIRQIHGGSRQDRPSERLEQWPTALVARKMAFKAAG